MGTSVSKTSRKDLKKSCPIGEEPILDIKIIKAHLEGISKQIKKDNSLKKNLMESVRVLDNEITTNENYENEKKKLEDNFEEKTKNLTKELEDKNNEIDQEKKKLNEKIEELEKFKNEKLKEFELEKKKLQEELLQMKLELEEQKELRRKEQEQYEQQKIEDANLIKKEEEEKYKAEKEKLKNELEQARKELEKNKKITIEKNNTEEKEIEEKKIEEKKIEEKKIEEKKIEEKKKEEKKIEDKKSNSKPKSEEEKALDYLINFYKSGNQENPIKSKINRELIQKIYKEIPSKSRLTLPKLIQELKEKSEKNNLSKENLIYLIFYWVTHNIAYDTKSFFSGRDADCTPEGVFRNGCGVCSGYARFYKYLNDKFNIETECITCYSKGYGYKVGEKPKSNHEYNAIKIDGNWYLIDPCWSAGHVNGTTFTFQFNEFYFCCPPEYIITDHFPDDKEWQLLPNKISVLQYQKFPLFQKHFFKLGFTMVEPFTNIIEGSGVISLKLFFRNDIESLYILTNLEFNKRKVENCTKCTKKNNYFDIQVKLNNKGDYLLRLFGSATEYGSTYNWIYDAKIVSKSKPKGALKFH